MTRIRDALLDLAMILAAIPFLVLLAVGGVVCGLFSRDTEDPSTYDTHTS